MDFSISKRDDAFLLCGIVLFIAILLSSIVLEVFWLPIVLLGVLSMVYLLTSSIRTLFLVTIFLIPFSTELYLPGGVGFDFPGEFFLLLLSGLTVPLLFSLEKSITKNWITILLLLHITWIGYTALFAEYPLLSFKYLLAKVWYILPFYFLPPFVIRSKGDLDTLLQVFIIAVFICGCYVFLMHGLDGWTFSSRTNAGRPLFRNHVNYACLLLLTLPACWYKYKSTGRSFYLLALLAFVVFLSVTYARIAYVAIAVMLIMLAVLRLGLFRIAILTTLLGVTILGSYFLSGDKLLHYAPDYENTVSHQRFDRLIEASAELKDISTMERAHRWVAGINMIKKRPWTGYGPSNFYHSYQVQTVNSFQTYVSDNPEKSGIHNYYLMLAVEQGLIGSLIFLVLIVIAFWKGALRYKHADTTESKRIVALALSWLTLIVVILMLNDMIEVIKVGPFFFIALFLMSSAPLGMCSTDLK